MLLTPLGGGDVNIINISTLCIIYDYLIFKQTVNFIINRNKVLTKHGKSQVEGKAYYESLVQMLPDYSSHITVIKGRDKAGCAIFYKTQQFTEVSDLKTFPPHTVGLLSANSNIMSYVFD